MEKNDQEELHLVKLFKYLLREFHFEFENELKCPSVLPENSKEEYRKDQCFNHPKMTFIFSSKDENKVTSLMIVGEYGEFIVVDTNRYVIQCPTNVRGLSYLNLWSCEQHGLWVEFRLFHKGCTFSSKLHLAQDIVRKEYLHYSDFDFSKAKLGFTF